MKFTISSSLVLAALTMSSSAHTIFQEVYVNGVDQGHINGIRVPTYDGPVTDATSNGLICNGVENPFQQPVSDVIITVPAGATVTAEWHHTLAGADPTDPADPVDPSHKGPVMTYLAQVPNALQTDVTGLKWFKIWEDGLDPSDQSWGVDRMIANKGKVTFTIPSCIPAGQYLMRHEMIALHGAENYPGAQFYLECAQLQITGGGSTQPATVSFPGAYAGTDPGIKINIYQTLANYTIPGPPVFSCDGSSALPPPPPSSATSASVHTAPPSSASSAPAPPPTGATAGHYAQCGGTGYTGPTVCAAPYTCTVSNEYYSQCL
ncbi:glycoside hydrolase family 61 protein [Phanerochaete sordida]|uniref:AA9 family lytic polysaccharide monooxygenase n=1 Tax=Phanerochaete sordida TaxID=48140 RepID=A0A9P3GIV6_9APHY|nr:glycoside hydrolase family 61 protein [Phanerochaete sordida]